MTLDDKYKVVEKEIARLERSRAKNTSTTQEKLKDLYQELQWISQFKQVQEVVQEWCGDVLYTGREEQSAEYYFDLILRIFEPTYKRP